MTERSFDEFYTIGSQLGEGASAVVNRCKHRSTAAECAVKIVDKTRVDALCLESVRSEASILSTLHHDTIVGFRELFDSSTHMHIVLELITGGELFDALDHVTLYSETTVAHMVRNILEAVDYLHRSGVAHRDIKPENLLLERPCPHRCDDVRLLPRLKLADFGMAKKFDLTAKPGTAEYKYPFHEGCGTMFYVAPEVVHAGFWQKLEGYNHLCDIWSVGVVVFMLLTGDFPFDAPTPSELLRLIVQAEVNRDCEGWKSGVSSDAKEFVRHLLTPEPHFRPSAAKMLQHHWLQSPRSTELVQAVKGVPNLRRRRIKAALLTIRTMIRIAISQPHRQLSFLRRDVPEGQQNPPIIFELPQQEDGSTTPKEIPMLVVTTLAGEEIGYDYLPTLQRELEEHFVPVSSPSLLHVRDGGKDPNVTTTPQVPVKPVHNPAPPPETTAEPLVVKESTDSGPGASKESHNHDPDRHASIAAGAGGNGHTVRRRPTVFKKAAPPSDDEDEDEDDDEAIRISLDENAKAAALATANALANSQQHDASKHVGFGADEDILHHHDTATKPRRRPTVFVKRSAPIESDGEDSSEEATSPKPAPREGKARMDFSSEQPGEGSVPIKSSINPNVSAKSPPADTDENERDQSSQEEEAVPKLRRKPTAFVNFVQNADKEEQDTPRHVSFGEEPPQAPVQSPKPRRRATVFKSFVPPDDEDDDSDDDAERGPTVPMASGTTIQLGLSTTAITPMQEVPVVREPIVEPAVVPLPSTIDALSVHQVPETAIAEKEQLQSLEPPKPIPAPVKEPPAIVAPTETKGIELLPDPGTTSKENGITIGSPEPEQPVKPTVAMHFYQSPPPAVPVPAPLAAIGIPTQPEPPLVSILHSPPSTDYHRPTSAALPIVVQPIRPGVVPGEKKPAPSTKSAAMGKKAPTPLTVTEYLARLRDTSQQRLQKIAELQASPFTTFTANTNLEKLKGRVDTTISHLNIMISSRQNER
eukprot:TRINITY_DN12962_c0_g2_i1.p1 TRINITY_DN12962_c0_g2~~TRINITY_DN12962_c0_g2_i1.p1  ORF type:complete len:984 (+),score=140.10 TRINITY_DN12962_c0_g2_i1:680-3631(+)